MSIPRNGLFKVPIVYKEIPEVMNRSVTEVYGLAEKHTNVLLRNNLNTIGDVLKVFRDLENMRLIGKVKAEHIRAAIFTELIELGAIDIKQEVNAGGFC